MLRIAKWIGIGLALLVTVVLVLPFFINVDQFRPTLRSELSSVLGREVKLGALHFALLAGRVSTDDLSVAEDPTFGKPAFLQAKSLHVGVKIWPFLLSRRLVVTDLDIDQPEISLVQGPKGDWNFSTLGARPGAGAVSAPASSGERTPLDLSVQLVKISNGRLTLRRLAGRWKPLVLEQANLEMRDFSATSTFPMSLSAQVHGGGTIELHGKAGPINPSDSSMTPLSVDLTVTGLDLAGSGMNDFAPTLAGVMSFKGRGNSDGTHLQMTGSIAIDHLKLAVNGTPAARKLGVDFSVQHDLRAHSGTLEQGDIHIGKALAHLTGSYAEKGDALEIAMNLAGPGMPIAELEAMLPAFGVVLPAGTSLQGGTASAELTMTGPADRLVTTGSLSLNNTRLAGFDMPHKMSSIEKLAGIKGGPDTEIQTLSAEIRSAPEGIKAQNMKLVVPTIGDLTGAGAISPANELNFRMSAILHTSGLLATIADKPIPFTVEGTCAQPIFKPDVKAVVAEEAKGLEREVTKGVRGVMGDLFKKKR